MRKLQKWTAVLAVLLGTAGCAAGPENKLARIRDAAQKADAVEARVYAPEAWADAHDLSTRLDAELRAQEGATVWFRDYGKAERLAARTLEAMRGATEDARAGKERARAKALSLIAEAETKLHEVRDLLNRVPHSEGAEPNLSMLSSDANDVETTLTDVQRAFASGDYASARTGAETLLVSLETLEAEVEAAGDDPPGSRVS